MIKRYLDKRNESVKDATINLRNIISNSYLSNRTELLKNIQILCKIIYPEGYSEAGLLSLVRNAMEDYQFNKDHQIIPCSIEFILKNARNLLEFLESIEFYGETLTKEKIDRLTWNNFCSNIDNKNNNKEKLGAIISSYLVKKWFKIIKVNNNQDMIDKYPYLDYLLKYIVTIEIKGHDDFYFVCLSKNNDELQELKIYCTELEL
jgi:hypothetical protein